MKLYNVRLTLPEINTLATLVEERIEDGSYYGNREHYYRRIETIKEKLEYAVDREVRNNEAD